MVVETRKAGNTQLYQLNPDSEVGEDLRALQADLISVVAERHAGS